MGKRIAELETQVHEWFGRFAVIASTWLVVVWAAVGPLFHFSPKWEQSINTGTALATLFMVFLIQNMQNRDARAINLKLNELIRAIDKARNQMIDIERLTDAELDDLQSTYEKVKTAWSDRQARRPADPEEK
jgi:low affinity Fe/Cu permease